MLPGSQQRAMDLAREKGASSWLTALPIEEFGFSVHKNAFRDAIALRYGWTPLNIPTQCACGASFSVQHALSCPKGGFPTLRHNEVRDLTAQLMTEVSHSVCVEPHYPLTGEALDGASAIVSDGARLDVAADGFWGGRYERAFFDIRVFNPLAQSNSQPISSCYRKHENMKKRAYEQRIREIEHGSFTPLVLSLTGGMGPAASVCYKRLASMLAQKRDQTYGSTRLGSDAHSASPSSDPQSSASEGPARPLDGLPEIFSPLWTLCPRKRVTWIKLDLLSLFYITTCLYSIMLFFLVYLHPLVFSFILYIVV